MVALTLHVLSEKMPSVLIDKLKKLFGKYKVNRIFVFFLHFKFGETFADTSPDLTDTISVAIID